MDLTFTLLAVFAQPGVPFSGNPLAVVEGGADLSTEQMQAVARQFNLSETTFVLPADEDGARGATARVRIFTPDIEMPFAGHPTLGTADIVAARAGGLPEVVLSMAAGFVPVRRSDAGWQLTTARRPTVRPYDGDRAALAAAVGLQPEHLGADIWWVDAGVEQLIAPVATPAAVRGARPVVALLSEHARAPYGESQVLLWSPASGADNVITARFFFSGGGAVAEDPATGSACANLGGWFLGHGERGRNWTIHQGAQVGRPSTLHLRVAEDGAVHVGGLVQTYGVGTLQVHGD